jgi:hypothetical protein
MYKINILFGADQNRTLRRRGDNDTSPRQLGFERVQSSPVCRDLLGEVCLSLLSGSVLPIDAELSRKRLLRKRLSRPGYQLDGSCVIEQKTVIS